MNSLSPAPQTATGPAAPPEGPNTAVPSRMSALRDVSFWAEWASAIGLVGLVIIFTIANPTFISAGNIAAMLAASAILVVLTLGQTYVIATGGIDLAVASTMTFAAVVFGIVFAAGAPIVLCMIAAIVGGGAIGLINGLLIGRGKITDFVVTLGAFSAASGLALVLSNGQPVPIVNRFLLRLSSTGIGILGWSFVIALLLAVIAHVVLFRTRFGTHVLAAGGSAEAATATGISVPRIKIAVYTISGVCAGIAAILLVARIGSAEPAANTSFLLNAVAAVVLGGVQLVGGRATIVGPFLGALLLTALTNGLTLLGVSPFYQPVAVGTVVVLAALLARYQR